MRKSTHVKTSRKVIVEKTVESTTLFKLTAGFQHSIKCKDGKRRSYYLYFLNNVLILKQKRPFDETAERGWDGKVWISNEYLLNGNLHQERRSNWNDPTPRMVKYPVSKIKLGALNVPKDLKIKLSEKSQITE